IVVRFFPRAAIQFARARACSTVIGASTRTASRSPEIRVDEIGGHGRCFSPGGKSLAMAGMLGAKNTSHLRDVVWVIRPALDLLEVIMSSFPLDLRSAAVNEQFYTRDETGVIRRQKQRHLSNFLRFPHASHRDCGNNPRNHVCRLPVRQRRIDRTRTENVCPDATVLQIRSPGSHERTDGSFTCGIDAEGGSTLNTRDRAVENDRATIIQ